MYKNKLPHQQLAAWVTAAVLPGAVQLTAGASWPEVLLASLICLLCTWLVWRWSTVPRGKPVALAQWLLLVAVMTALCKMAPQSWPGGSEIPIALMLLALALWSALKGTSAAAGVGCVLFWFLIVMYLILLGAGIKEIRPQWLLPGKGTVKGLECILLLTPTAASIHLNKEEACKPRLLLIPALCTAAAAVTSGVLSPQVAVVRDDAFYEMTRSLNLLGQARRFEALLSAGMTAGWFTLLCLYLTLCARWAENLHPGWGKPGMILAALLTAAGILLNRSVPFWFLLLLVVFFWVLVPVFSRGIDKIKKSK